MVDPRRMCRQHLLGEHVECHMFAGSMRKGLRLDGYVRNNLFEPSSLKARHDALVREMEQRGYRHRSPFPSVPVKPYACLMEARVDRESSADDLFSRCRECRARRHGKD